MQICYVLWSASTEKFYVGCTQEDLNDRIFKHNSGFYNGKNFTKGAKDWQLYLQINAMDFAHAVRLERKIKAMKSSKYIRNLKKYPAMIDKIYNETMK